MLTHISDGLGITLLLTFTILLMFFGLGSLSYPSTWSYKDALHEAFAMVAVGFVTLFVAIMMIIT